MMTPDRKKRTRRQDPQANARDDARRPAGPQPVQREAPTPVPEKGVEEPVSPEVEESPETNIAPSIMDRDVPPPRTSENGETCSLPHEDEATADDLH